MREVTQESTFGNVSWSVSEIVNQYEGVSVEEAGRFLQAHEDEILSAMVEAGKKVIEGYARARGWFLREGVDIDEIDEEANGL